VLATAREAGGELLAGCDVFDVYAGAAIGEGRRSLGIRLTFQSPERTLSDEEVLPVRARIVEALVARTGATLRGGEA
jgi:phenylalanyl-tRNA synthetase beta chain